MWVFQHFFGWYDIDEAQLAIRHRLTAQEVAFAGRVEPEELPGIAASINRHWMRFCYSDPEVRAELLVESLLSPGDWGRVWYLDYAKSFPESPPFGLWQRLDSFVVDALTIFPKTEATGEPTMEVAAVGGWHLGFWHPEIVRVQKPSATGWCGGNPPVLCDYLPPLDGELAKPWRLCESGETIHQLPPMKALRVAVEAGRGGPNLLAYLSERMAADPFLASDDDNQLLISVPLPGQEPKFLSPLRLTRRWGWEDGAFVSFAYLDLDCLYFAIGIHRRNHREETISFRASRWQDAELLRLRPEGFVPGELTGYDDPVAPSKQSRGDALGPDKRSPMMPQWLGLRLREALPLALEALTAAERQETKRQGWNLHAQMENFADGSTDREYFLQNNGTEIATKRSNDGVLQTETRRQIDGWWDFDPELPGMINRITGQKITLHPDSALPQDLSRRPAGIDNWWRLTYSDDEMSYSLPVGRPATPHADRTFGWAVLYGEREAPAYGCWRRAHLAILDALSCWPTTNAFGRASSNIITLGGWSNGRWDNDIYCQLKQRPRRRTSETPAPQAEPALPPLDAAAPAIWTFVDALDASGQAWLKGLTWADLRRIGRDESDNGDLYFSGFKRPLSGRVAFPFSGFQSEGPYLLRADGSAVFFPARLHSGLIADMRGEFPMYQSRIVFLYADLDIVALFQQKGTEQLDFDLQNAALLEHQPNAGRWLARRKELTDLRVPSHDWWLVLQEKFADLGMAWRGSPAVLHDDPARIEHLRKIFPSNWGRMQEPEPQHLSACEGSSLIGCYRGGIYDPRLILATSRLPDQRSRTLTRRRLLPWAGRSAAGSRDARPRP